MTTYLDPAPVLRAAELRLLEHGQPTGRRHVAQLLDVELKQVQRWTGGGLMFWLTADRCALALGLHPLDLWPTDWLMDETASERRRRRDRERQQARRDAAAMT